MLPIQNIYPIISHKKKNKTYYHLVFFAPDLCASVKAGQFIHIKVSDGLEPLFRRPFSVYRAQNGCIEVFYEPVGQGTKLLTQKKQGDVLDVLAPLGNSFQYPHKDIEQIVFIGGGIGIAPLMIFSDQIKAHSAKKILLYGVRNQDQVFSLQDFKKNGFQCFLSTDDGSKGIKGHVSQLFPKIQTSIKTMIYTCGPRVMMKAVADFAKDHQIPGQMSMEEVMACGLGACLGCSILTTTGYQTVCHDGPVFDLQEVVFS